LEKLQYWDCPGGPVAKTLCFLGRGCEFNPLSWNSGPHAAWQKNKLINK